MFTFKGLSPDLWFKLLVASEGYDPAFINMVDPSSGAQVTATLVRRDSVNDPHRVFRGRVEDSHGSAVRDAVVRPVGALFDTKTGASLYGSLPGLDPIAISNKGERIRDCVLAISRKDSAAAFHIRAGAYQDFSIN